MSLHSSVKSMQKESLQEMIDVADFCINFDKRQDPRWSGSVGCYGYPGALLLLSVVDCIGKEVYGGGDDMNIHFKILNDLKYYNLSLSEDELKVLIQTFRNKLSHNGHIKEGAEMCIGDSKNKVLVKNSEGSYRLSLRPFLDLSKKVVNTFIS